jgi:hypothetical protein
VPISYGHVPGSPDPAAGGQDADASQDERATRHGVCWLAEERVPVPLADRIQIHSFEYEALPAYVISTVFAVEVGHRPAVGEGHCRAVQGADGVEQGAESSSCRSGLGLATGR